MRSTLIVAIVAAYAKAQQEEECYEDGFEFVNSCFEYTGDENDRDNCIIMYRFNTCGPHMCQLENDDGKADCMPYLEDPDFWNSIRDRRIFNESYEGYQLSEYWNWFHDHSDEALHTWEEGAGDWQDNCWYEKHDLEFNTRDVGFSVYDEDGEIDVHLFYDPCNKWSYPQCELYLHEYEYTQYDCYAFEYVDEYVRFGTDFEDFARSQGADFIADYWHEVYESNQEEMS
jgi:hypothetical protein